MWLASTVGAAQLLEGEAPPASRSLYLLKSAIRKRH